MSYDEILILGLGAAILVWIFTRSSSAATIADEGVFPTTPPATPTNALDTAWQSLFPKTLSPAGAEFIKQQEGLELTAYGDAGGYSIGYGHHITGGEASIIGESLGAGSTITEAQAEQLFNYDVSQAEAAVNSAVGVPLSQLQFDALIDFVFNEGAGALQSSTLLADLNAGDYAGASQEFASWNISGGRVNPVLVARRAAEQALFNATTAATTAA